MVLFLKAALSTNKLSWHICGNLRGNISKSILREIAIHVFFDCLDCQSLLSYKVGVLKKRIWAGSVNIAIVYLIKVIADDLLTVQLCAFSVCNVVIRFHSSILPPVNHCKSCCQMQLCEKCLMY